MNALTLIIAVLACWRVTSLISRERGLFAIGTRLREMFGVLHDESGVPDTVGFDGVLLNSVSRIEWVDNLAHEIAEGIVCFWCCSIWVALVIGLMLSPMDVGTLILHTLAISGGAIFLDRMGSGDS